MKKGAILFYLLLPTLLFGQFDFYGPKPFGDLLDNSFNQTWSPSAISGIENKKYVIIIDQATQTKAVMLNSDDRTVLELSSSLNDVSNSTYGSLMRSIFQIVDRNTHFENDPGGGSGTYTPLSGEYRITPVLHSYYSMNASSADVANSTDSGSFYIFEESNTGYLLIEFEGTASSTTIKAVSQWEYDSSTETIVEVTSWNDKWLMINGANLIWTSSIGNATNFILADATELLDVEIGASSDFNPLNVSYQPNATTEIPEVESMEDSKIITDLNENTLGVSSFNQLGTSTAAATAAAAQLDEIETTLTNAGAQLMYPKEFYLELRENMLSHKITSTDIYNGRLDHNTIEHVYFTNAMDNSGVPHPFMVVAAHAISARPNLLLDVNRPPGGSGGPGYGESQVTRHGKLGGFLIKIPLKSYGLISTLDENDLSPYGDLASDYDATHGTTTVKDVYNYASTISSAVAVDGVSIYPAQNNNLRFAVADAEVTSSGIHVGGGLELHYHADGHAFNGNGINLYNISDYDDKNHPPVIGVAYDGVALFAKYETAYPTMIGIGLDLDDYGGHDHNDNFGYHYHAHTQNVTVDNVAFDEHFLMVGAWRGNINSIPAFDGLKVGQLMDPDIARYVGGTLGLGVDDFNESNLEVTLHPNPVNNILNINVKEAFTLTISDNLGRKIESINIASGTTSISLEDYSAGLYFFTGESSGRSFIKKIVVSKK